MEPHGQSPWSLETPTRGEHPVPEDQFTHAWNAWSSWVGIELALEANRQLMEEEISGKEFIKEPFGTIST